MKWSKKWRFVKTWGKNATQILIFLAHTQMNLWGRKMKNSSIGNSYWLLFTLNLTRPNCCPNPKQHTIPYSLIYGTIWFHAIISFHYHAWNRMEQGYLKISCNYPIAFCATVLYFAHKKNTEFRFF